MPTNREKYFELVKLENKYLSKSVIVSLLMDASGFEDRTAFYGHFNDEVKELACVHYVVYDLNGYFLFSGDSAREVREGCRECVGSGA